MTNFIWTTGAVFRLDRKIVWFSCGVYFIYCQEEWRRQLGRPRITWLSTVQQDLKQHHLTLPESADLAQNRPLWRMMSTYGATQS